MAKVEATIGLKSGRVIAVEEERERLWAIGDMLGQSCKTITFENDDFLYRVGPNQIEFVAWRKEPEGDDEQPSVVSEGSGETGSAKVEGVQKPRNPTGDDWDNAY